MGMDLKYRSRFHKNYILTEKDLCIKVRVIYEYLTVVNTPNGCN